MLLLDYEIRPIERSDNNEIRDVIRTVMPEFGAVGSGFSIEDTEVLHMFEAYQENSCQYFVAVHKLIKKVVGGSGIGPLIGADDSYCELKKMYLLADHRRQKIGYQLMQCCLDFARISSYRYVYLETLTNMMQAKALYEAWGFERLDQPLGATGHHGCDSYYLLDLQNSVVWG